MPSKYHTPVLLNEIVGLFSLKPRDKIIDATLGGGGHTQKFLEAGAQVLGIDCDQSALESVSKTVGNHPRLTLVNGNFSDLEILAKTNSFSPVDAILFDLGVSSHQLDSPHRGFSFRSSAQLDMRMDQTLTVTAQDLLAALSQSELTKLFQTYGDERLAKPIAKAIVEQRQKAPIDNTQKLQELVQSIYQKNYRSTSQKNPATKVFQALRIAVNDEINSLKNTLPQAVSLLSPKGIIAVISFHSTEDRIVKHFFIDQEKHSLGHILTKKPITPAPKEKNLNPRSSSAKLRAFQKNEKVKKNHTHYHHHPNYTP